MSVPVSETPLDPGRASGFGSPAGPGDPNSDPGATPPDDDDDGRIGIFPSWNALYVTVILYTAGLIAILRVFTVMLDTSTQ